MFKTTRRALGVFTLTLGCALTTLAPTVAHADPATDPRATEGAPSTSTLKVKEYLSAISSVSDVHYLDNNRIQIISERSWKESNNPEDKQGIISILNLETKENTQLETRLPAETLTAITRDRNYTLIYDDGRNRKTGGISIYDSTKVTTVADLPKFPDAYAWTNTPDGTFYAVKGYDFFQVSPTAGTVSKVASLTAEPALPKYGSIISPEYDPRSGKIWALVKNLRAPELVQIDPKNWQITKRIDLLRITVDDLPGKFIVRSLFSDISKNRLYMAISPASSESDKRDLVLTYDLAGDNFIQNTMRFASTMSHFQVHPTSHEIFGISSSEKAFYIANPSTFKVAKELDLGDTLTDPRFTSIDERGAENLQSFTFNPKGTELISTSVYPTKQYNDAELSTLTRIEISAVKDVFTTGNQDNSTGSKENSNPDSNNSTESKFEKAVPAAPQVNPDLSNPDVKTVKNAVFHTSFTEYMREFWGSALLNGNVQADNPRNPSSWDFTKGTGWINQKTNEAEVVWAGALEFRPYEILVPDMFVTFANPVYTRDSAGNEKISFDMYWNLDKETKHAENFQRVNFLVSETPATTPLTLGADTKFTFNPAYSQVHYRLQPEECTPNDSPCKGAFPSDFIDSFNDEMKAWWYATSGSRNSSKLPGKFHLSLSITDNNDSAVNPGQPVVPGQPQQPGNSFKDIASYPFVKEINWLATSRITTGYADKTFRPHDSVSRAAMAAFIYRLEGKPAYTAPKQSPFKDIKPGDDFYKEICWLAEKGITTGYADGTFRPWDSISREAMAAFLHRYDQKVAKVKLVLKKPAATFSDAHSSIFAKDIAWLSQTGVTTGYQDGSFHPFENIERGAIAAFFYRMKH